MTGEIEYRRHLVKAVIRLAQDNDDWQLSEVTERDNYTEVVFELREPYRWIKRDEKRWQGIGTVKVMITAESTPGESYA